MYYYQFFPTTEGCYLLIPKKSCQVRSHVRVMLTVFFDSEGVVQYEFLPQGRTVNKEYYLEVMQRLREAVR